jgi:hypothetical protein
MERRTRKIGYRVESCPHCKHSHEYELVLTLSSRDKPPVFFGGETDSTAKWDITLECPETVSPFVEHIQVPIEPGEHLESVGLGDISMPDTTLNTSLHPSNEWLSKELAERVQRSQEMVRQFCTTMITVNTGAIPVYFTVLNYLDNKQTPFQWLELIVIPPLLFMVAAAVFAFSLRPVLIDLHDVADFAASREKRLRKLDRQIKIATHIFFMAVLSTIGLWFFVLKVSM